MRLRMATLYLALGLMANMAHAADWSQVEALREGGMKKLIFVSDPQTIPDIDIVDVGEVPTNLDAYRGKWVVLNFWATWCAPCRHEMPTLANLQRHFEGSNVEVVTVATGRNSPTGIRRFFDEIEVTTLPEYRDPRQALARAMGVLGLPITVVLDPDGREVARLRGDADWDTESAIAIMTALAEGAGG